MPRTRYFLSEILKLVLSFDAEEDWNAALLHYHLLVQCYIEIEGPKSLSATQTLTRIAEIYQLENRLAESAKTYFQVLSGYKSLPGDYSEKVLNTTETLAAVLNDDRQYGEAYSVYLSLVAISRDLVEPERQLKYDAKLCEMSTLLKTCQQSFMTAFLDVLGTLKYCGNTATNTSLVANPTPDKLAEISERGNRLKALLLSEGNPNAPLRDISLWSPEMLLDGIEISVWFSKMAMGYLAELWFSTLTSGFPLFGPEYRSIKIYGTIQYGFHYYRRENWEAAIRHLVHAEQELGDIGELDEELGNYLISPSRLGRDVEMFPLAEQVLVPGQSLRDTIDRVVQDCRENSLDGSARCRLPWEYTASPVVTRLADEMKEIMSEYFNARASTMTVASSSESCKYGLTYSVSDITGISDSCFMVP